MVRNANHEKPTNEECSIENKFTGGKAKMGSTYQRPLHIYMQRWFDITPDLVNKSSGYGVTASAKHLVPRGNAQTRPTGSCPCRCTFGRQYVSIELQMACIHPVELAVYARLWVPNGNVWKGPTAHCKYCCTSISQACLIELKGSLQRF